MLKMQVIDIELVTGIIDAKNGLHRVGGGGVGGFFGEETAKLGRGNECGRRVGLSQTEDRKRVFGHGGISLPYLQDLPTEGNYPQKSGIKI
jgi:hypothetical protein